MWYAMVLQLNPDALNDLHVFLRPIESRLVALMVVIQNYSLALIGMESK